MPRTYKKRRKRYGRKRKHYYRNKGPRNMPLTRTLKAQFRYQQSFNLDAAVITPGTYVFRANGMYDPDASFGGHQPRGFDQLIGVLYDHYVVIGVVATVYFHNTDTTQGQMVGIAVRDTATAVTTINDYLESGNMKYAVCSDSSAGQSTRRVSYKLNPNKFLGRSKPLSDPQLKGSNSADPVEGVYFHVFAGAVDQGVNPGPVQCTIMLTYTAVCIEPKQPAQS